MNSTRSCHAEASVELSLTPDEAWNVVMDWKRQSRWMLFTRVWATENDGAGVGGGVAARTSVGGIGFTDDMVITHWDPPRECTVEHLGKLVRGTGTFTIEPTPANTTPTTQSTNHSASHTTPDSTSDPATAGRPGPAPDSTSGPATAGRPGPAPDKTPDAAPDSALDVTAGSSHDPSADSASAVTADGTSGLAAGGCRFTWAEDVVPPLGRVGVLVWPVVRPGFEAMMRVSLRRLVREVQ
jgi:hypothetical protein